MHRRERFVYYIVVLCRRILIALIFITASAACYWSVQLARADWMAGQATLRAAKKSIELAPANSAYLRHAAELLESEGLPDNALLERAALRNPLDSRNLIHIAARWEMEGRTGEAEKQLLRAFEVDRQFEPRLALANFYFRAGNAGESLAWARKALDFGRSDPRGVFQLCWAASGNATVILEHCIPHRARLLAGYLQFLDSKRRLDAAGDVATALMPLATAEQSPMLLDHCTKSLEAGRGREAIRVWNQLRQRGLCTGQLVDVDRPSVDSEFQQDMTGQGFDWGMEPVDGVKVVRFHDRGGVRIVFSRNAPEHSVILKRWVALSSAGNYRLRATYRTAGMTGAGLSWIVQQPHTNTAFASAALPDDATESRSIETRFEPPPGEQVARLELRYDRAPGTVRPEGSVQFSRLVLEPAR